MKYFACLLTMKDEEKNVKYRPDHLAYLQDRRNEGKVFANGRFMDGAGGLIIYRAESLETANALAENDPYVRLGARSYAMHEWEIVL